jgi:hypothetical protein
MGRGEEGEGQGEGFDLEGCLAFAETPRDRDQEPGLQEPFVEQGR